MATEFVPYKGNVLRFDASPAEGGSEFVPYQGQVAEPTPARQRTFTEDLLRQAGLAARIPIEQAAGVPLALGNFFSGAQNLATMGANKALGTQIPLSRPPSDLFQSALGKVLPAPETPIEHGVNLAGSIFGPQKFDPVSRAITNKISQIAPKGFNMQDQQARAEIAEELRKQGLKFPPSKLRGGALSRTVEGVGGEERVERLASFKNQEKVNRMATDALGFPPKAKLTYETLRDQAKDTLRDSYDPIKQLPEIGVGAAYHKALAKIKRDFGADTNLPAPGRAEVRDLVDSYLFRKVGKDDFRYILKFTGEEAIDHIKLLREEASGLFSKGEHTQARARRELANALEDQVELHLKGRKGYDPAHLVEKFKQGRVELAKNYAVRDMLVDADSGMVDTAKAQKLVEEGVPLSGKLRTIAKAGSFGFAGATQPAISKPPAINYGDAAFVGGGLASPFVGPLGPVGAAIAALPILRSGARHAVLSEPVQNYLVGQMANQPNLFARPGTQAAMLQAPAQIGQSLLDMPFFSQGGQ